MTKYAALVGDLDEGVTFFGLFDTEAECEQWLEACDMQAWDHCETLPVEEAGSNPDGDQPHILVTGSFQKGFRLMGPFGSFEDAEQASGKLHDWAMPCPLQSHDCIEGNHEEN